MFASNKELVSKVFCTVNSLISDHNKVNMTLGYNTDSKKSEPDEVSDTDPMELLDFDAADEQDWNRINLLLSKINWIEELKNLNTEVMYSLVTKKIETAASKIVRMKISLKKGRSKNKE